MYYYQLLVGKHQDSNSENYSVNINRDKKGKVISVDRPIIKSEIELDKKFMPGKFRRLSEAEVNSLLNNGAVDKKVSPDITAPIIITGNDPVNNGEVDKKNQCGNVTEQFPKAIAKSLIVYKQVDGSYFISNSSNEMLIDNLKSRIKVHSFIKNYKV